MKRLAHILLAMAVMLPAWPGFGVPRPAHACSCVPDLQPDDPRWNAVFLGRAIEFRDSGDRSTPGPAISVTFDVVQVWRGDIKHKQEVVTSGSSASCGYDFENGKQYLVHGSVADIGGTVRVNMCSPTTAGSATLARRLDELLGPHHAPVPLAQQQSMADEGTGLQSDWPRLALAGAIAVALGAATVFVARRR